MRKKLIWIIPLCLILILVSSFLIYTGIYYHADGQAQAALKSTKNVNVSETDYGYFFDGPSEENVLVFYPGAKVEETAYAPLLRDLAGRGVDVCLVRMPFRLAAFGKDKAGDIPEIKKYENRYIGGHSLGGAMAASYAAEHGDELRGVILLAAYPTEKLDDNLLLLSIYGSKDGVLNMKNFSEGEKLVPKKFLKQEIKGGNHAYFGNYGKQKGDSAATITSEEQQEQTVEFIIQNI